MPNYNYHCEECDSMYQIWHGMTEEHNSCNVCGSDKVVRIPSSLRDVYVSPSEKVGTVVNNTIEETKKEVERYKKELMKDVKK